MGEDRNAAVTVETQGKVCKRRAGKMRATSWEKTRRSRNVWLHAKCVREREGGIRRNTIYLCPSRSMLINIPCDQDDYEPGGCTWDAMAKGTAVV